MLDFLRLFVHMLAAPFRTQAQLEAEITMLRHQLNVVRRQAPSRPRLTTFDRLLFVWLCQLFPSLRSAITIVQPDTVLRGHRSGFRLYWRWKSRARGGRPKVPIEIRSLIRGISEENRLWGGKPFVTMMEATDRWEHDDLAGLGWVYRAALWTILVEREVCSR